MTITVNDNSGSQGIDRFQVTVRNVPPELYVESTPTAQEGDILSLSGVMIHDPGIEDTLSGTINWGDDSTDESLLIPPPANGGDRVIPLGHVYADDGVYTVTITLADDVSDSRQWQTDVHVEYVPPVVVVGTLPAVDEAQKFELRSVTVTDKGVLDSHNARISWGDGAISEDIEVNGGTITASHTDALIAILAEWTSGRGFSQRVTNIGGENPSDDRLNDDYFLRLGETLSDDIDEDTLNGGPADDWLVLLEGDRARGQ